MMRRLVLELIAPLADGRVFDLGQMTITMSMSVIGTLMGLPREDWPCRTG